MTLFIYLNIQIITSGEIQRDSISNKLRYDLNKKQLEQSLRERFIKLYQSNVGKGPDNAYLIIEKNYIIVELTAVLTQMERNLLDSPDAENLIRELRVRMKSSVIKDYTNAVEMLTCRNVVDIVTKLNVNLDTLFMLIILDKNISEVI